MKLQFSSLFLTVFVLFIYAHLSAQPANNNSHVTGKNEMIDVDEQDKDSFDEFTEYEGKIISKVNIKILNVSGPSVEEGSDSNSTFFGNIGNALHYKSREWVVRNMLLFAVGDSLDARKLSESERLLRSCGFFLDARIKLRLNKNINDSISVDVTTKDRWTLTPLLSYNPKAKGFYSGVRDDNFLGLGHNMNVLVSYDQDPLKGTGGSIKYSAINVAGTFINAGTYLEANRSFTIRNLNLSRPYLSTEIEWTGGLDFTLEQGLHEYFDNIGEMQSLSYKKNILDFWIGKSYPLFFGSDIFKKQSRLFTSGRVARTNFSEKPFSNGSSNRLFENFVLYLFSFGIFNQRFYKDTYLGGFGIIEDIPIGGLISVKGGTEYRESSDRLYAGIDIVYSTRLPGIGYFSGKLGIDGFKNTNNWEQQTFKLNILYHSPIVSKNKWKFRFLGNNDYLFGFNRFEGEQIYLDNENGLRGFNRFSLFGTRRILFNSEVLAFSPYSILGFKLGGMAFADMGLITANNDNVFNSKLYQGYGAGIRINNESIARAGFQISFVYNPFLVDGNSDFKIQFSGNIILGSRIFGLDKPAVTDFNELR